MLSVPGADLTDADLRNASLKPNYGHTQVIWNNTSCPDGSNSDDDDGDGFTCDKNFKKKKSPVEEEKK